MNHLQKTTLTYVCAILQGIKTLATLGQFNSGYPRNPIPFLLSD